MSQGGEPAEGGAAGDEDDEDDDEEDEEVEGAVVEEYEDDDEDDDEDGDEVRCPGPCCALQHAQHRQASPTRLLLRAALMADGMQTWAPCRCCDNSRLIVISSSFLSGRVLSRGCQADTPALSAALLETRKLCGRRFPFQLLWGLAILLQCSTPFIASFPRV